LVNPDHLGYKESLENKDLVVLKDPRAIAASLVYKVFQALLALEVRRARQEKLERMEILEHLDLADPPDLMVL
jgi:hypothetical protein